MDASCLHGSFRARRLGEHPLGPARSTYLILLVCDQLPTVVGILAATNQGRRTKSCMSAKQTSVSSYLSTIRALWKSFSLISDEGVEIGRLAEALTSCIPDKFRMRFKDAQEQRIMQG